jgi:acetyltransferase
MDKHYLNPLFSPESIAVFAGQWDDPTTQTPQAQTLLTFLRAQRFSGTLTFLDIHTTGTLADLAQTRADLAIIALPHEDVAAALDIAGRIKCRAAVVISTGINATLASELNQLARHHGMYLLGPNCLGFQRPRAGLNASVAGPMATPGPLALVSQSGALTSSILDWASQNAVGFSTVVSLGPNTSVDIAQVLDFLASDQQTHSIVVYLEGISNARRFMSALRAAANAKPVVVLKAGRKTAGNKAARTHSGAIVGSDDVFDAALRRAGAVRVRSFVALFSAAKCLASRYRARRSSPGHHHQRGRSGRAGSRLDQRDQPAARPAQCGVSAEALKAVLPAQASLCDLIDLSEDASPEHYRLALDAASKEKEIDGILVIHSPKTGCDAAAVAAALADFKARISKPLLACWMGDASVGEARTVLNTAMIPTFRTP